MTDLEKFQLINVCEAADELAQAVRRLADPETGKIRGKSREFNAERMAGYVTFVVNEKAQANLLTREFGIRQQALYLRHCIENGI